MARRSAVPSTYVSTRSALCPNRGRARNHPQSPHRASAHGVWCTLFRAPCYSARSVDRQLSPNFQSIRLNSCLCHATCIKTRCRYAAFFSCKFSLINTVYIYLSIYLTVYCSSTRQVIAPRITPRTVESSIDDILLRPTHTMPIPHNESPALPFVRGGLAGCIGWMFVSCATHARAFLRPLDVDLTLHTLRCAQIHPADVVKTRLQVNAVSGGTITYSGPMHVLRSVYATEGVKGLYSGLSAALTRQIVYGTLRTLRYPCARAYLLCFLLTFARSRPIRYP